MDILLPWKHKLFSGGISMNSNYETTNIPCVHCDAGNCMHNEGHSCNAEQIDILGTTAQKADQTICSSFQCK